LSRKIPMFLILFAALNMSDRVGNYDNRIMIYEHPTLIPIGCTNCNNAKVTQQKPTTLGYQIVTIQKRPSCR
jgi:hypothetical protein